MNGKKIFKVIAVVGLVKLVMGSHRHRMGTTQGGNWHDHVAELHRELHRSDAEAMTQSVATPTEEASTLTSAP